MFRILGDVDLVYIVLWVTLAALAATTASSLMVRLYSTLGARRLARYQRAVESWLSEYVVGMRDDPPPAPGQSGFQRAAMRQDLRVLASELRGEASDRLARLFEDYGLVEAAYRDLDSRRPLVRVRAADALGTMRVDRAAPQLRGHLRHDDPALRVACARALAELGDVDALPDVVLALGEVEAPPGEIADILLRFGAPGTPHLRGVLSDGRDPAACRLAAAALGEIRTGAAVPELTVALHSGDDELAATAARSLGRVGDIGAMNELVDLLRGDRTWFVRVAAASAIGALDTPVAAPALVGALSAEEWDLRNAAATALSKMGNAGFDAVLHDLDELPDRGVAHYAGVLDMADELSEVIARAAGGDREAGRFVQRCLAAGVRARLEEAAAGADALAVFARRLLEHSPGRAPVAAAAT